MIQSIAISQVRPNPYQSRSEIDQDAVKELAEAIKDAGFWNTTFRVRQVDGHYELAFGHQRLAALRLLGEKKIEAEIIALDDRAMAEQSLIENLQRRALLEMDRAESIRRLVEMEIKSFVPGDKTLGAYDLARVRNKAIGRVRKLLGYESSTAIDEYLEMAQYAEPTKEVLRKHQTGHRIAVGAKGIGGEAFVRHVAREGISKHEVDKMGSSLAELPKEAKQKVIDKIIEKKVTEPERVKEMVRREQVKIASRSDASPDLLMFVDHWTQELKHWTPQLKAAGKHREYIHKYPEIASEFKTAAEEFIGALRYVADLK